MTRIGIAIATYKRPDGLRNLLYSIRQTEKEHSWEILCAVVDNDPESSARSVCAEFFDMNIEYSKQPVPGISSTRNQGVRACLQMDYIVFVDDDEVVAPDWLKQLLLVQERTNADLVAGPVLSVLPPSAPPYIRKSRIFDRPTRKDGEAQMEAGTGNLLCRAEIFRDREEQHWFQEELNLVGGEDSELTRRLYAEGARISWAANAVVSEEVPESRITLSWLARRYRRVGSVDYRLKANGRGARVRGLLGGLTRMLFGVPSLGFHALAGRLHAPSFRRFFRGLGYVEAATLGGVKEYQRKKVYES